MCKHVEEKLTETEDTNDKQLRHVRATTVMVEKQRVLHYLSVYL